MNSESETPSQTGADLPPTIKMYQDIVDRSHKEIEHVRKTYYWLSGVLGLIISVGIATFAIFNYKNIHEMKSDMKEELESMKKKAALNYGTFESDVKSSVDSKIRTAEQAVKTKIDDEFTSKNINELVKNTAKERIDAVADTYISHHVTTKITPKISAVTNDVKMLQLSVDFNATASAASSDDKFAFIQLRKYANDKNYAFHAKAEQYVNAIISPRKSVKQYLVAENSPYPGLPGVNLNKITIKELIAQYKKDVIPAFRYSLIETISKRPDFGKKDKISFCIDVITNDKSLDVTLYAVEVFNKITGQNFDEFDFDGVLNWFEKNKGSMT